MPPVRRPWASKGLVVELIDAQGARPRPTPQPADSRKAVSSALGENLLFGELSVSSVKVQGAAFLSPSDASAQAPACCCPARKREAILRLSIDAYVSMVVLTGRAVVIGSAWRCAIFQVSPSRRKIMVTRSAIGAMFSLPSKRAWVRSSWTM